ncbi:hypothetical protein HMPREF0972_00292 [Actinomyces sp. oral taxon 848 str. F0332]|nr:hypothetical protein HMPREF0972_00292 [Actinomyces sp. oral taxon 848 str. F0332]
MAVHRVEVRLNCPAFVLSLAAAFDEVVLDLDKFVDARGRSTQARGQLVKAGRGRFSGFAFDAQVGCDPPVDFGDCLQSAAYLAEGLIRVLDQVGIPIVDGPETIGVRSCHGCPPNCSYWSLHETGSSAAV